MGGKLSKDLYSAKLFDLAQDIAGGLPIKLVERWLDSGQAPADAARLLKETEVRGYSVVSDAAGLTRLTKGRGLIEILALINVPKEIVYGYGSAVGGHGVGIWAADNTQMFYPATTSADQLVSALLTIQDEIARRCQIRIGLGAHFGDFYQVSGGLYGEAADAIEELTETNTEGGEVAVSQAVIDRLTDPAAFAIDRWRGAATSIGAVYRVLDGPRLAGVQPTGGRYPIPYSEAFYADLVAFEARIDDAEFGRQLADKYLRDKTVVLVERQTDPEADLLADLALSVMVKDIGLRQLGPAGVEVKVVGSLGIYLFDDQAAAVGFATRFRADLSARGIACTIGIDSGPVLVGELPGGGMDIAGGPVNIASKMAQDLGSPGRIYLSEPAWRQARPDGFSPTQYAVSGIQLTAFEG